MFDRNDKTTETNREVQTALWLIGGISLFWALAMVWANLGTGVLILVTVGLNAAITKLGRDMADIREKTRNDKEN